MSATLNFVWIGEPRFDNGGSDVVGPITIHNNLRHFASETKENVNPMVFWCLEKHQKTYKDYFEKQGIALRVKAIEPHLKNEVEGINTKRVVEIMEELLGPGRNEIVDRACVKDLFFNYLLATEGGYVLDTSVQANPENPIHFPEYSKFMFPYVISEYPKSESPEVWMQYAPPNDLSYAKKVLNRYFEHYKCL